ncbi:CAP domain-containing protein [Podospora conica]|nr:CAP domain-containing protein [Schizothecium conicum]
MKSSVLLAVSGALMAVAAPVLEERKVVWKTAVAIKWVTQTVTAKAKSTTTSSTIESTTSTEVSTTSAESTTSTPPPPAPEETKPPAPVIPEQPAAPAFVPEAPPLREFVPEVAPQAPAQQAPPQQAAPAAPAQQVTAGGDYANTMLYHHNVHRSNHSSPDLVWSTQLEDYARQAASKCVFEHDLSPGGGGYGQNLAFWGGTQGAAFGINRAGAQAASNMWYNGELPLFPGYGQANPGGNFAAWGHFSQLVWAGTQQVGCVSRVCPAGTLSGMESIYTVCNYSPPGNMGGQYANNIRAPQGLPGVIAA